MQLDDLKQQLEYSSSQHAHLNMENEFLRQEVLSLEELKMACGKLEEEKKELEEKILTLQSRENASEGIDPRGQYEAASEKTGREKTLEEAVQSLQVNFSVMCFSSFTATCILDVYVVCGSSVPLQKFVFKVSRKQEAMGFPWK